MHVRYGEIFNVDFAIGERVVVIIWQSYVVAVFESWCRKC